MYIGVIVIIVLAVGLYITTIVFFHYREEVDKK